MLTPRLMAFDAGALAQAIDVMAADGEFGIQFQQVSGQPEGFDQTSRLDNLVEDAGTPWRHTRSVRVGLVAAPVILY